MMNYSKK